MQLKLAILSLSVAFLMTACGGGGDSDQQLSDTGVIHPEESVQLPIDQPVVTEENILSTVRIADVASELTAATFSLNSWSPRALVQHNDILYISDYHPTPQILRYDLKNKRALSPITLSATNALGRKVVWTDLTDIYIEQNRLYVATGTGQRVDVFNLNGAVAELVMSLGTGSSSGDQSSYVITYPMGIAANKDYVFVADQQNRINVWKQEDVKGVNDLSAKKISRLSLPTCVKGCVARLEVIGNQLYASTNAANSYVYDIDKIVAASDSTTLIEPNKTQNSIATVIVNSAQEGLVYAAQPSGRIQSFKQQDVQAATTVLPSNVVDSAAQFRLKGQSQSQALALSNDLIVYGDELYTLGANSITVLPLRRVKQKLYSETATPKRLLETQATTQTHVLQDGESWSTLTNVAERHVFMDKILSAQLDRNKLRLQSYSAVPVRNLQIQAKLRQSNIWVNLVELDSLKPFSKTELPVQMNTNTRFNRVDGQGSVQLEGLNQFVEMPADLFEDIRIHSETDTHVQKLNSIKAKWKIYFGTYDEPGKWCRITPVYAREWVIMMTNLAYMLSTSEFETLWFNHKAVMGHDFFGNAGKVDGPDGFYKAEDYARVYQDILNRDEVNLGVTNMGGGLGGWKVLGVDTWLFYGHYRLSGFRIIAHEFGHRWGGHNSAWAMAGYGFEPMVDWLNFYFQRRPGSLPYMDPNVNAFHLTPDTELCQGVNQNMVKGVATRAPWNKVDEYFKNNPINKN
ncbi:NHL repeat-containing protein [Acinetobacter terrae]|uniref:hypothetical protein n=1 Tax=Acinetobacter terrae TaxID=2731247 RepID=UPI0012DD1A75|nr:hypothetical protein [Acinetobacter terrae]